MTYQEPTTGLHSPTLLAFLQKSTDYLMLAQSWKFGVNCCSIGLTHPAACTGALVPLTFGHVHRPPFHPICSERVAIDWAWADIFEIPWEWPKLKPHWGTIPPPATPLPDTIRLIHIPIDSSRRQDSEYIIYTSIGTWRQKIMILTGSWWWSN